MFDAAHITSRGAGPPNIWPAIIFDFVETPAHDTIPVEQEFADKLAVAGGDHAVLFGGNRSISLSLAQGGPAPVS
jgi:hypothetical protein